MSERITTTDVGAMFLIGLMLGGMGGCGIGIVQRNNEKREWLDSAVKAEVAEYYLDANNERQFRWKTNNEQKGGN